MPECVRHAMPMILLLAGLVAGCAAPAESPALRQADAAVERARSAPRVRALAPAELDRAEAVLEQARAAARAGASPDQVEHLAYVVQQRAALAEARATERVAQSEVDGLQRALDQVVPHGRLERVGRGSSVLRARQPRALQEQARAAREDERQQGPKRPSIEGDQPTSVTLEPNQQAPGTLADPQQARASIADDQKQRAPVGGDLNERASIVSDLERRESAGDQVARLKVFDDQQDRATVADGEEAPAPVEEHDDRTSGENGEDAPTAEPDPIAAGAAVPQDITLRLAELPFEGAEPTSATGARLAALAERLLREPERGLAIEAEFDLPDPEARTLMERRVEVVRALLLQRGIAPARLVVRAGGAGLAKPQSASSVVEAP